MLFDVDTNEAPYATKKRFFTRRFGSFGMLVVLELLLKRMLIFYDLPIRFGMIQPSFLVNNNYVLVSRQVLFRISSLQCFGFCFTMTGQDCVKKGINWIYHKYKKSNTIAVPGVGHQRGADHVMVNVHILHNCYWLLPLI